MALPASGQISLNMVNVELDKSGTALISLNDAAVRTLFGKSSGTIAMSDGHGKSNYAAKSATGGTKTTDGSYTVHVFNSSTNLNIVQIGILQL